MQTTAIEHIAHLVAICASKGIREVIISPGSRNAPLIIAFDAHPKIKTYVVHDERSAAFFALGLAESLNRPVAICCTSGSAALNYAPAIAEAYYRYLPLLILTADRPPEWIDQGDGQTIRQKNVYHNYIKAEFQLPEDRNEIGLSDEIVRKALKELLDLPAGPVHINIPLDEPLYGLEENNWEAKLEQPKPLLETLDNVEKKTVSAGWQGAGKKMILIGQQHGAYKLPESLKKLMEDPSVVVLTENTSQVKDFARACHCIDRVLASMDFNNIEEFQPDILISIGGAIVSKRIKQFFRKHKPEIHWRVGKFPFREDTFRALTASFQVREETFFDFLLELPTQTSNFGGRWKQLDFLAEDAHGKFISTAPWSDLLAFEHVLNAIPENSNLHLGNSSVVRYGQLFNPVPSVRYFSNRGVSGIDGSTSTALGMANGDPRLMTLITGDISFFYDSNALWNNYLPPNLRIILVNNGGGGIFRYIPGPTSTPQRDYFFAPHSGNAEKLCAAFGVHYLSASSAEELDQQFDSFYMEREDGRPVLLEIDTTNEENEVILHAYFGTIARDVKNKSNVKRLNP